MRLSLSILSSLSLISSSLAQLSCQNYGIANGTSCACPPGFGGADCSNSACGGTIFQGASRPLDPISSGFSNFTTCSCTSGWRGAGCNVCEAAEACQSAYRQTIGSTSQVTGTGSLNTTMQCNTSGRVYASGQMSCQVVNQMLQAIYPGSSYLNILRSIDPSQSPLSNGSYLGDSGTVLAQLFYNGVEQFYCRASDCSQQAQADGSSSWQCSNLQCSCRSGTTFCGGVPVSNLTATINGLDGTLGIDCEAPTETSGSTCAFKQQVLQSLFGMTGLSLSNCYFGECVPQYVADTSNSTNTSTSSPAGGTKLDGGVIAGLAVIGSLILAALALFVWGSIQQRSARAAGLRSGAETASDTDRKIGTGVRWSNVGYTIREPSTAPWWRFGSNSGAADSGKVILDGVSGQILPGQMMAILGPSGAGKTTLVELLANKNKEGWASGSLSFFKPDGSHIAKRPRIGFVDQSDILPPTLTVREALLFAARLRLPESTSDATKVARVFEVMSQLGIDRIADTIIGSRDGEGRGVSGGEMRRVSIGLELVGKPEILILDEPTSGLDSVSALTVMTVLRSLARDPKNPTAIIASIHQPSSRLFQIFDEILVLANGRSLYGGPGGQDVANYFAARGAPCPEMYNMADHLLDLASNPPPALLGPRIQSEKVVAQGPSGNNLLLGSPTSGLPSEKQAGSVPVELRPSTDSSLGTRSGQQPTLPGLPSNQNSLEEGLRGNRQDRRLKHGAGDGKLHTSHNEEVGYVTTYLTQFQVLCGREWLNLRRDKSLLLTHILVAAILGIFCGGLYYQTGITIAGFQSRVGCLFFLGSLLAFSALSALSNIVEIKPLFLRERSSSYYSPAAWLLARFTFDVIPLRVVPTIIVSTITYWMAGLSPHADRFFKALLILVLFSLAMTLFNFMMASVFRNGGIAIFLSSLFNLFTMTFAGFFVHLADIPPVLRWLQWLCPLKYCLEALSVNEVAGGLMIEDTLEGVPINISASLIMQTLFGFGVNNYYRDVLILFGFIGGFGVALIATVWVFLRERR